MRQLAHPTHNEPFSWISTRSWVPEKDATVQAQNGSLGDSTKIMMREVFETTPDHLGVSGQALNSTASREHESDKVFRDDRGRASPLGRQRKRRLEHTLCAHSEIELTILTIRGTSLRGIYCRSRDWIDIPIAPSEELPETNTRDIYIYVPIPTFMEIACCDRRC